MENLLVKKMVLIVEVQIAVIQVILQQHQNLIIIQISVQLLKIYHIIKILDLN
jgi:hypothetical protein